MGTVAAVLLLVGSGWYQVFTVPPYYFADEQAHVGYVLELQGGRLPTIGTPIDGAAGGPDLQQQLARSRERSRDVWVANNPPLPYILALPGAAIAQALDLPGGPVLGLRLTNLAAFAAAVAFVTRLGRRLAGDDPAVGLVAAALFATVPHVAAVAGAGFVDGFALLCTVALVDALVAITQSGPTRRQLATLAIWCAAAAATRPMTAVLAGFAIGLAVAVVAVRRLREREAGQPVVRTVVSSAARTAAALALPTVVVSGWFYLRNQRLYGDPTASSALFEKFDRQRPPNPFPGVLRSEVWSDPARTLLNRRFPQDTPSPPLWLWDLTRYLVASLLIVAVVLILRELWRARREARTAAVPIVAIAVSVVLAIAATALAAQHWTGGGNIHPRYLLFPLVVVAMGVAFAAVRLGGRPAGFALVVGLIALQGVQIPRQNRSLPRPGWALLPQSSSLTEATGPAVVRYAGLGLLALALGTLAVALAGVGGRPFRGVARRS